MSELMTINLEAGEVYEATISRQFGPGYAVLRIERQGISYDLPVQVGSALVHESYAPLWRRFIDGLMGEGDAIQFSPVGIRSGGALDVVEVLTADRVPLSVYAIHKGWAIPDAESLRETPFAIDYLQALSSARMGREGIWSETSLGELALSSIEPHIEEATRPSERAAESSLFVFGPLLVMAVLLWTGISLTAKKHERTLNPLRAYARACVHFIPRTKPAGRGHEPIVDDNEKSRGDRNE